MNGSGGSVTYHMGVDGISMLFVILTTFLMPICILASWQSSDAGREYMLAFLVLETLMIGVFCSLDLVLFYLFFEGGLIPMFLIIGIWGGPRRVYASFKFFLYTLLGSVLMLLAIIAMYWQSGTTDIAVLLANPFPARDADLAVARVLRLIRRQDAHVAGPHMAAGRACGGAHRGLCHPCRNSSENGRLWFLALLAADVPGGIVLFAPLVFALSIVAIIYTSLVALMQEDMKKLIAYSSVAHMGFVTMGIFTFTRQGIDGALSDDLAWAGLGCALFVRRRGLRPHAYPRDCRLWRSREPNAALCLHLHGLHHGQCRLAGHQRLRRRVPDTARRLPEQYVGRVPRHDRCHPLGCYALWLYRRVVFGDLHKQALRAIQDMTPRELTMLAPLIILTVYFGVYPEAPGPDRRFGQKLIEDLMKTVQAADGGVKAAAL